MEDWLESNHIDHITEMYLPHVGYPPFAILAKARQIIKINFIQESLQLPQGMLAYREGMLLQDEKRETLFTSEDTTLSKKLSMKYYNLQEKKIPLHLHSVGIGCINEFEKEIQVESIDIDYMIIAGKAMNCAEGILFAEELINIIDKSQEHN